MAERDHLDRLRCTASKEESLSPREGKDYSWCRCRQEAADVEHRLNTRAQCARVACAPIRETARVSVFATPKRRLRREKKLGNDICQIFSEYIDRGSLLVDVTKPSLPLTAVKTPLATASACSVQNSMCEMNSTLLIS